MKRKWLLIGGIVLMLLVLGVFLVPTFFSGPMYEPGDLTRTSSYAQLLQETPPDKKENVFALNEDVSLYYEKHGEGEAVLVIHGGPGIPYEGAWAGLNHLDSNFTFYYPHQRGCGNSSRPIDRFDSQNFYQNMQVLNEQLGLPAQLADIEQIRRKLKQEKITLIGHSFGGFLACLYAIEFPEHVKSLVLIAPANVVKIPATSGGLYDIVQKHLPEEYQAEYQQYMDRFFDFSGLFEKSEQELVELNAEFVKYYKLATNAPPAAALEGIGGWVQMAVFMSMGQKHDYSQALAQIQAPTLILHGEQDLIPVESVQLYVDHIPNNRLQLIPASTHFPFNENPSSFEQAVSSFLKSH